MGKNATFRSVFSNSPVFGASSGGASNACCEPLQLAKVTKAAPIATFLKNLRRVKRLLLIVSLKNSSDLLPKAAAKASSNPPAC